MSDEREIPKDPLQFIRACVSAGRLYWTYHVNMRLAKRCISRQALLRSTPTYEIVESYPRDKYLPSYLVFFEHDDKPYHALFGVDVAGNNVRVVTVYSPALDKWSPDLKRRKHA